jgi:hypothetical protein
VTFLTHSNIPSVTRDGFENILKFRALWRVTYELSEIVQYTKIRYGATPGVWGRAPTSCRPCRRAAASGVSSRAEGTGRKACEKRRREDHDHVGRFRVGQSAVFGNSTHTVWSSSCEIIILYYPFMIIYIPQSNRLVAAVFIAHGDLFSSSMDHVCMVPRRARDERVLPRRWARIPRSEIGLFSWPL